MTVNITGHWIITTTNDLNKFDLLVFVGYNRRPTIETQISLYEQHHQRKQWNRKILNTQISLLYSGNAVKSMGNGDQQSAESCSTVRLQNKNYKQQILMPWKR